MSQSIIVITIYLLYNKEVCALDWQTAVLSMHYDKDEIATEMSQAVAKYRSPDIVVAFLLAFNLTVGIA